MNSRPRGAFTRRSSVALTVALPLILLGASGALAQAAYRHSADCWLENLSNYGISFVGTNPTQQELFEEIKKLGAQYDIPMEIIGGVLYQESGGYQYGSDGFVVHNLSECRQLYSGTLTSAPPGLGLMQLTGATARQFNVPSLITDWRANLAAGVSTLNSKYVRFYRDYPTDLKSIMIANRNILENWFYGTLGYNGFISGNQYPYRVYNRIAAPAGRISGLFYPVGITRPETVIPGFQITSTSNYTFYAVTPDGNWHTTTSTYQGAIHFAQPYRSHTEMAQYLTGVAPTPSPLRQVDYNRDGRFDVADVVAAVNFLTTRGLGATGAGHLEHAASDLRRTALTRVE